MLRRRLLIRKCLANIAKQLRANSLSPSAVHIVAEITLISRFVRFQVDLI